MHITYAVLCSKVNNAIIVCVRTQKRDYAYNYIIAHIC